MPSPCPDSEDLRQYALGLVPEERADDLECHLQDCPACEQTIDSMEGDTAGLLAGLPAAVPVDEDLSNPLLLAALERAESLVPDAAGRSNSLAAEDRLPSERIGPYRLVEQIGHGGMGVVYRAVHVRLEKPVAAKVLARNSERSDLAARFEQEIRLLRRRRRGSSSNTFPPKHRSIASRSASRFTWGFSRSRRRNTSR